MEINPTNKQTNKTTKVRQLGQSPVYPYATFKLHVPPNTPNIRLTTMPPKQGNHPLALRVQVLTLITYGFDIEYVEAATKMPKRTIRHLVKKAKDRGYKPHEDPRILEEYVADGKATGRPRRNAAAGLGSEVTEQGGCVGVGVGGDSDKQDNNRDGDGDGGGDGSGKS